MTIIKVRRLAELDLDLHGKRFILTEFAAGVFAPIALGAYTLASQYSFFGTLVGIYLVLIGINYAPLFIYAVSASRKSNDRIEYYAVSRDLRREIKKYSLQQVIIFVPFAVLLLALIQERMRVSESEERNP